MQAERVDHRVDDDVADKRCEHLWTDERRRDRINGAQQSPHDPRLAPDLGSEPAGEQRHEAGREGEKRASQEPARRLQPPPPAQPIAEPADRQHREAHDRP